MINRTTKLRWRRRFRAQRRQVEDYSQLAEDHIEKHFIKRLSRIAGVRRFVISWMLLFILLTGITLTQTYNLSAYYQELEPTSGGTYTEGIIGTYTNSNPLYATSDVDTTISKLIFPGLLKYDQSNHLVTDLAQSFVSDARGENYTVILKDGLKWQDGTPLTANDVVFTFNTIQNPDAGSPLFSEWQKVKISAVNANTILFTLPNALASFPDTLTTGIIPQHILGNVPATQLRSAPFNTTKPIGDGPFILSAIDVSGSTPQNYVQDIGLAANSLYFNGHPKLDRYVVKAFNNQAKMIASFQSGTLDGMVDLNNLPEKLQKDKSVYSYNIPLTAELMAFFNNSQPILSDVKVRQALVQATNEQNIISGVGYSVIPSKSPLLPFQIGYTPTILQYNTDLAAAKQALTADGWVVGAHGFRYKNNQLLTFNLYTQNNSEYEYVAESLKQQWGQAGVNVNVYSEPQTDLQNVISNHEYDILLYGISLGVDPDVYAYWDSSQAQPNAIPGLNLSIYKDTTADLALESGRTRVNPAERAVKYQAFLKAWVNDAPAVALYQPHYLYITRGQLFGFSPTMLNTGTDRLSNVDNWEIREVKTTI